MSIRIDFASEGCQWEIADCQKPGSGTLDGGQTIYCAEHLLTWAQELARRTERDKPKLSPAVDAWYRRMTQREVTP